MIEAKSGGESAPTVQKPGTAEGKPLHLLCLEDNQLDAELVESRLKRDGLKVDVKRVETRGDFVNELDKGDYDLILSDYSIPSFSGREALELAVDRRPDIPFIFFSGTIGEERAVECLKVGATDFVLKDKPFRLVSVIRRALENKEAKRIHEETAQILRTRDMQFHALVEQSIVGVYVIQDGMWVYVNPTMAAITGHTPQEVIGEPVLESVVQEDRAMVTSNIEKRLAGTLTDLRYRLRLRHKTGSVVDVESHGSATDFGGKPAIMGVLLNVTERKRAEDQIREQATLLDKALNGIVVWDMDRRIRYWNGGATKLYGWSFEDVRGKVADPFLFLENKAESEAAHKAVLEKGEWHGELKQAAKNGRTLTVECHWSLIRDEAGAPKSIFAVASDVTVQKKVDSEMRRSQRMDSIGALAGGIAHDLNNVLAPILMGLALLRRESLSAAGQKLVDVLESGARRGADMVKQILLFARGSDGEKFPLEMNQTVKELVKIVKQTFAKNIRLQFVPGENLWSVMGDRTQLHQVMMNLCVNAKDAMPDGGTLTISTKNVVLDEIEARMYGGEAPGSYVMISVTDTGSGIPAEIIDRIFEPFFTTKEVGKGTGLGLATVVGLVKSHGGFVKVQSEAGQGTTFQIYLPATAEAAAADGTESAEALPTGNGELLLVVEDEVALREITQAALEKSGYRVLTAADGTEAVGLFATHKDEIAVVIADMVMPVMDGATTIRCLQRINPEIKVIAMSGLILDRSAAQLEPSDNIIFLTKPFDTRKLLMALKQVMA